MEDNLSLAHRHLLAPGGLQQQDVTQLLGKVSVPGIDYADIYFQHNQRESWALEDGRVRAGSFSIDRGFGVRAVSGGNSGFAHCDDLSVPSLQQAGSIARQIAAQARKNTDAVRLPAKGGDALQLYGTPDPLVSIPDTDKVALLQHVDAYARGLDTAVLRVSASLAASHDVVFVMATDGTVSADVRPLVRFDVSVIVQRGQRRERGFAGGGGRFDYAELMQGGRIDRWVRQAVDSALLNLEAIDAPAGTMPVVLGPGWPGVLLHEAVGHGLEGDFNRKGTSAFAGRMGQQVASELCTVVDDGTLPGRRGSLAMDDEGVPGACTVLIEKGVLTGYMQDKLNARLTGLPLTGNGRRESYAHLPMPRMTNTYLLPGETPPEEIIASVDRGLYAVNFGGGQVDITSGNFVFSTTEAWLVEKGRAVAPVRGATLIGNGPEVMGQVSMLGNDLTLDEGVGVCGKEGQSVPVGVGQPTLKIDALTVGGTAR